MVGPIFTRELFAAPRRTRFYTLRVVYPLALMGLAATAWLLVAGNQLVRNLGDLALFGTLVFQFLAPVQLALLLVLSPLGAAGKIALEKDRRTLDLLLLTRISDTELVLGETLAGVLSMLVMTAASLPVFFGLTLLGGIDPVQVLRIFFVYIGVILAAGSLGACLAFWREKTFQTVALSLLAIVGWIGAWEAVRISAGDGVDGGSLRSLTATFSPWRALQSAVSASPVATSAAWLSHPSERFLLVALGAAAVLNGIAVWRVRVWNTVQSARMDPAAELDSIFPVLAEKGGAALLRPETAAAGSEPAPRSNDQREVAPAEPETVGAPNAQVKNVHADQSVRVRKMWEHPILWREVRTWAYGRKMIVVRLAFVAVFLAAAVFVQQAAGVRGTLTKWQTLQVFAPLFALSLLLVNALAVNSLCQERDGRTLDLLLTTDLSPREILFSKLAGVYWNAKEMILLPILMSAALWFWRDHRGSLLLSFEQMVYMVSGLATLQAFAAVLGIHTSMTYASSRAAMAVSLGTLLFLFLGVAACMRLLIAFGDFNMQFIPFSALIFGGGVALFATLGARNPSPAIGWTAFLLPVTTFYALNSFLLDQPHMVWVVTLGTFGFSTAALLIPALSEFDFASSKGLEPSD